MVVLSHGGRNENFGLVDGRVHLPTVARLFNLTNIKLNDCTYPASEDGFTFHIFRDEDPISVTGIPAAAVGAQAGTAAAAAGAAGPSEAGVAENQPMPKRRREEPPKMTPSTLASLPNIHQIQEVDGSCQVPCFELDRDGLEAPEVIPVQLMCSAFERFCHVNHHSSELPPTTCKEYANLLCTAVKPYHLREKDMAMKVLPVFQDMFSEFGSFQPTFHGSETGANTDPCNDGQLTHALTVKRGCVINLAIVRGELKVLSNPADPMIQNVSYQKLVYMNVVKILEDRTTTEEQKSNLLRRYPFPALLITISGVDVQVDGAVITGSYARSISVRSQHLSDKVPFIWPRHSGATVDKLARLLYGVREAVRLLCDFYSNPPSAPLSLTNLPCYPVPHYVRQLCVTEPESVVPGKLLWRGNCISSRGRAGCSGEDGGQASNEDGGSSSSQASSSQASSSQAIVVKYSERYSVEVHKQWAEAGLAPDLIHAVCLAGNYTCVVMRDLEHEGYQMVSACTDAATREEAKRVALDALIRVPVGTVHGDLRTDNAMLGPAVDSGDRKLLFIDFEWAGREGETKYPLDLNSAVFRNGAKPGCVITHQHDMDMVAHWD